MTIYDENSFWATFCRIKYFYSVLSKAIQRLCCVFNLVYCLVLGSWLYLLDSAPSRPWASKVKTIGCLFFAQAPTSTLGMLHSLVFRCLLCKLFVLPSSWNVTHFAKHSTMQWKRSAFLWLMLDHFELNVWLLTQLAWQPLMKSFEPVT